MSHVYSFQAKLSKDICLERTNEKSIIDNNVCFIIHSTLHVQKPFLIIKYVFVN